MARVVALRDIKTEGGLTVAEEGRKGVALRGYGKTKVHYGKVPVRWDGRKFKVYWVMLHDIGFVNADKLDPYAYVARPPDNVLIYPPLPSPPGVFDYHFGKNLKRFRTERGIGQNQLSRMLAAEGIKACQTTISWWERKKYPPRGKSIDALAKILEVPAFMLMINFADCVWLREVRTYINKLVDDACEEESV